MKYFSSRRREIFLAWIFVLHRDVVISASGGNFDLIYHPEIDGIPSRSQNPTAQKLTVGCYFKEVVFSDYGGWLRRNYEPTDLRNYGVTE
jgi:hypothetical protein